jgi:hypothetical protein
MVEARSIGGLTSLPRHARLRPLSTSLVWLPFGRSLMLKALWQATGKANARID